MLETSLPLLLAVTLAGGLGFVLLRLSALLGPRRPSPIKAEAFECGNPASGPARYRFNVKFYLVAILFLIFDIETVFIYPWAVVFRGATQTPAAVSVALSPQALLLDLGLFVAVIVVALVYAWKKGALDWYQRARKVEPVQLEERAP